MTTYDLLRALRELAIEAARAGGPLTPRWLEVARALSGIPDTSVRRPDDDVREPDVELRVPVRTDAAGGEHFVRLAVPAPGVYFVAAWTGDDASRVEDASARGIVRAEEWIADGARLRELLADDGDEPSAISVTREETAPVEYAKLSAPPELPPITIAKRRR